VVAVSNTNTKTLLRNAGLEWQEGALETTAIVSPAKLKDTAEQLQREDWMLLDLVGVDYLEFTVKQPARFAVIYNLYHIAENARVFLKVFLEDGETLPSLFTVWRAANYLEREVYDLVGVVFDEHPDLRKVLTPEDLEGHPLRKDFPLGESPTLFGEGRFLDPSTFRAGVTGKSRGLSGYKGGERSGTSHAPALPTLEVFTANVEKVKA